MKKRIYDTIKEDYELLVQTAQNRRCSLGDLEKQLEEQFASLINKLRKIIDNIPDKFKEKGEQGYINSDFKELKTLFANIKLLEHYIPHDSDRERIPPIDNTPLFIKYAKEKRYDLLSFLGIAELLNPEVTSTEKEVELIFKLREFNMESAAEQLEAITETSDLKAKCVSARTALEQVIVALLESNSISPQQSFWGNLDLCAKNALIEKSLRDPIAVNYRYASKLHHGEIECSESNVKYAIAGIYTSIEKIIETN